MSDLDNDTELADGRENKINKEAGVKVELRDQIPARLLKRLNDIDFGKKALDIWHQGNMARSEWLDRQEVMLRDYDEFIKPIYKAKQAWQSTLHLPISFTHIKTYHARMYSALMSQDPPFTVNARQSANVERALKIQGLMRYTLKSWANEYKGVNDEIDQWLWNWVSTGCGILKGRWKKAYTKFEDVETIYSPGTKIEYNDAGEAEVLPDVTSEEKLVERTFLACDGPIIENVPIEDVLIVGGNGDPQLADHIIHSQLLTASELSNYADQSVFDKDVVQEILKSGDDNTPQDVTAQLKEQRAINAGLQYDHDAKTKRYQILEVYTKVDLDGSGIGSDVIVWVHAKTKKIVRATYLYRAIRTGRKPFFKIDFHKRPGQEYGIGLVELLWSLSAELDAMHNIRLDSGALTLPFGFYDPSSSLHKTQLVIEPGSMVALANPRESIYFPDLTGRGNYTIQEESLLNNTIERLTSLNDITFGQISGQGASRTATGARMLGQETNANLDIFIQRMNRGWDSLLQWLFCMLQQKIKPGFEFRILGEDGRSYFETIHSREELLGAYDFEIESNSANSNPAIRMSNANQIYQMSQNPLDYQLQIMSPAHRYEAVKNLLQAMGVKDYSKYCQIPQARIRFTPLELATRILYGVDADLSMDQDLEGLVAWIDDAMADDYKLAMFNDEQVQRLANAKAQAMQAIETMKQAEAQVRNIQQVQMNSANTTGQQQMPAQGVVQGE